MYIYHALINALSAHMIHINLNMILYTHVEHSPTKTICIKYYTKQKTKTKNEFDVEAFHVTENCFKGNSGETSERRDGAHNMGFPEPGKLWTMYEKILNIIIHGKELKCASRGFTVTVTC